MAKRGRPPKSRSAIPESSLENTLDASSEILTGSEYTPEAAQVDEFFDEIAPKVAFIEIYRMRDDGRRPQLGRFVLDLLKEDVYGFLRSKFGTGRYLLLGRDNRNKYLRGHTIEVEQDQSGPTSPLAAPQGADFNQQLILALIAAQKPVQAPPPIDVGSLLQGMAAMKPATPDLAALIVAIGSLNKGGSEDWVEKAQKIIELSRALAPEPGGSKEDNLYTVIKDVGNKAVEAFTGSGGRIPAQIIQTTTPAQTESRPAIPQTQEAEQVTLQRWIETQLVYLKEKARRGKDPEAWVDYVIDNDEEPGCNALLSAMERGATFDHLLQFDKEIAQDPVLTDWFRKFYDALHSALQPPMDTAGAGGDAPNPAGNETAGPTGNSSGSTAGRPARKPR